MRLNGKWVYWNDGLTRPMIQGNVLGADGIPRSDMFLIDTGADRTVFCEPFYRSLGLTPIPHAPTLGLQGVSGSVAFVEVQATLLLHTVDQKEIRLTGTYAAFTDPTASDYSILGREILDIFDLIVSRRRDQGVLLTGNQHYQITP